MITKKFKLQKLISESGITSRRKAEVLIIDGKVSVNGQIANIGDKGSFEDNILVDGVAINKRDKVYYLLNKPEKIVCTLKDNFDRRTIVDIIKTDEYIYPIGRLDYNTTGIIILTNDGELTNKLLHPSNKIKRVYRATLDSSLSRDELNFLNSQKVVIDLRLSRQSVVRVKDNTYNIELFEGRNHHVKKLFKLVNKAVITLNRIEFAGLKMNSLERGKYRELTLSEVDYLKTFYK